MLTNISQPCCSPSRNSPLLLRTAIAAIIGCSMLVATAGSPLAPCRIEVVEQGTGWPVPLIELRTTHFLRFVSDNAGVIALDAPEVMDRDTWFEVLGHGYEVPKDGFGYHGVRLHPEPGKTLRVEVRRISIARCLGRATGAGQFAESQKLGGDLDWKESGVFGCDTVEYAVHRGKMFWFWGDTALPNYPLGIFDSTGATTDVQPLANFEPPLRLRYHYFTDAKGNPRGVAKMPGAGPTWIAACVSLPDSNGIPRLGCTYSKIRGFLEPYQSGLCVWNDAAERFDLLRVIWNKTEATPKQPPLPDGHAVRWKDEQGKDWVLFGNPLPVLRCPATFAAWQEPTNWETLSAQTNFLSATDGTPVIPHAGSIAWNPWRKRWITIFVQNYGHPSALGEVWYAEADAPTGPWGKAVKILTHENYTFYNPCLHPEFTASNSPVAIFEGTYAQTFADRPQVTARYDYDQMMYRLDLDDPRLRPAQQAK